MEPMTQEVAAVLKSLKDFFRGAVVTKVSYSEEPQYEVITVRYHNTDVMTLKYGMDGRLDSAIANTDGHRTATTKSRINDVCRFADVGVAVSQIRHEWWVLLIDTTKYPSELSGRVPFADGIDLWRLQHPHSPVMNPALVKRERRVSRPDRPFDETKKVVYFGDEPLYDFSRHATFSGDDAERIKENILGTPPMREWGPAARQLTFVYGFHPNTQTLYFLTDPSKKSAFRKIAQGDAGPPIFHRQRPTYGHPGTIPAFWKNKNTKSLAGAVQFYVDDEAARDFSAMRIKDESGKIHVRKEPVDPDGVQPGDLVITHMAVKPAWRKSGLNMLMVRYLVEQHPHERVVFEDVTPDGLKFARKIQSFLGETVYHYGPKSDDERGWSVHPIDETRVYE